MIAHLEYVRFINEHRRFLGFGMLLVGLSGVGQTFLISLFGGHLRDAFGLSNAGFGLIYSAATLCSAVTLIWVGRLVDVVDLRRMTVIVLLGGAVGCLLLAGTQGMVTLVVAFFVLRLSGQGLMTHVAQTSMARYFEAGRGKAISIAMAGLPLSEGIAPVAMVAGAAALGWRTTWIVAAVMLAGIALPLALALLRGHDQRHAEYLRRREHRAREQVHQDKGPRHMLRHPLFHMLLPAVMAPPFIITALFIHQVPLAESQGWTLQWLATSFAGFAATHLLALVATGPLVDRMGARRLVPVFLAPLILALTLLSLAHGDWVAPVYLALAGISAGAAGTIMGALWAELYGTRYLGSIRALVQGIMVTSTALAPALAGALLDAGLPLSGLTTLFALIAVAASALAASGIAWARP